MPASSNHIPAIRKMKHLQLIKGSGLATGEISPSALDYLVFPVIRLDREGIWDWLRS